MADRPSLSLLVAGIDWPPETFLGRLLRALADQGVDVTLATDQRLGKDWQTHPNVRWLAAPRWKGSAAGRLLRLAWWRVAARARRWGSEDLRCVAEYVALEEGLVSRLHRWHQLLPFAGRRWDVIYFPWNTAAITYLPLFDLGMPVVISCRGSQVNVGPHDPRREALRAGLRDTLQRAAAVHCVSQAIAEEARAYGLHPGKAWVIRPAVDPDFFRPSNVRQTKDDPLFRIVTTGSLVWRKGYEYALLAIRHLLDAGLPVRFDIVGAGPEKERVLYTIYDLDLVDVVRLWGRLPPEGVRERLQQADVFLLSSLSEGISNAVLEAMACGLPVVSTDCGGMREVIDDGVEGFLTPTSDPAAMAHALCRLQQSAEVRRQMGRAARQRIFRQQLTLEQQAVQFKSLMACTVQIGRINE